MAKITVNARCGVVEQIPTAPTTAAAIMRRPNFVRGVEDYRKGRKPAFDDDD
jgi:hypothetical protein